MKKVVITLFIILLISSGIFIFLSTKSKYKPKENEEIVNVDNDSTLEEEIKDELIDENTDDIAENSKDDIHVIDNSNKNNIQSNNNGNTNVVKDNKSANNKKETSTQSVQKQEENKHEETKKEEQPQVKETEWSKLGLTEEQYKNQPMYSWEDVDFNSLAECTNYGDNNPPYSTGEGSYDCNEVTSWTRTLGWDFVPHYR